MDACSGRHELKEKGRDIGAALHLTDQLPQQPGAITLLLSRCGLLASRLRCFWPCSLLFRCGLLAFFRFRLRLSLRLSPPLFLHAVLSFLTPMQHFCALLRIYFNGCNIKLLSFLVNVMLDH
jgi:hypothetical protein